MMVDMAQVRKMNPKMFFETYATVTPTNQVNVVSIGMPTMSIIIRLFTIRYVS